MAAIRRWLSRQELHLSGPGVPDLGAAGHLRRRKANRLFSAGVVAQEVDPLVGDRFFDKRRLSARIELQIGRHAYHF